MFRLANISAFESLMNGRNYVSNADAFSFPESLEGLREVGGLDHGAFIPSIYEDGEGHRWVYKRPHKTKYNNFDENKSDDGFGLNEVIADDFYRAMGADVPESRYYGGEDPGRMSRFIEGCKDIGEWFESATPEEKQAMIDKIYKNYHIDLLLGNDDVLNPWNIIVDENGTPWRIDNGSSFFYDSVGGPADYRTKDLSDIWISTGRAGEIGYPKKYEPRRYGEIKVLDALRRIADTDWTPGLAVIPEKHRDFIKRRVSMAKSIVDYADSLYAAGHNDAVVEKMIAKIVEASPGLQKHFTEENKENNAETS